MIELPDWAIPSDLQPYFVDAGGVQRSALNTAGTRLDRAGSHYGAVVSFPPQEAARGRVLLSRLLRATSQGLRLAVPLLGEEQGYAGVPVVDGAGAAGTSLPVRGLVPYWAGREGYWVEVQIAGQSYLHCLTQPVVAGADGKATLSLWPELRAAPADSDAVIVERPHIAGMVTDDQFAWQMSIDKHLHFSVTLEELG